MFLKKVVYCLIIALFLFGPFSNISANSAYFNSALTPNDSFYSRQWYLTKIKAESAWEAKINSSGVIIAIIDSGVQIEHPDLVNNIWINENEIPHNNIDDDGNGYVDDVNGWDFVNDTSDPNPKFTIDYIEEEISHGTIIAGIAAAQGNNSEGVTGVAWNAKIMPLMVLDSKGTGGLREVIKAIDYAIMMGADIINFSFVGEAYSPLFESAIRRAYEAGILIVAAAGNNSGLESGRDLVQYPMYPVCNDGFDGQNMVIGVAATDSLDQKTSFSGYGTKCIDISAPGVSIYSTSLYAPRLEGGELKMNKYYDGYWSGTSMATPMVSGAAALILAHNPSLNREELIDILLGSADYIEKLNPDYAGKLGTGRLNIGRALLMAENKLKVQDKFILNFPKAELESIVDISDLKGNVQKRIDVLGDFRGEMHISAGKISKYNNIIVAGAGQGGGPHVQVFTKDGKLLSQFFAYDEKFRGGVNVAVGDIDGDGVDDIITGAGPGGGPHVRVFNIKGELMAQFFAYNKGFRGGVTVAVGDIDGDGDNDIITGAGPSGGPHVRIFTKEGKVLSQFFAYESNFRGGVNVATGDFKGGLRKLNYIITSPASNGGPHIKVFDKNAKLISSFFAYGKNYRSNTDISAGDIDGDGMDEIVTGAGIGGAPHVRTFELNGDIISSYYAYPEEYLGGVGVGVIN